jgi:ribonucleoside-diphosphate reductase alpha chain
MDSFATAVSMALQYGVPLQVLVDKFTHTRFEPSGFTKNPDIPMAKSIMDYIFRWLASKFLDCEAQQEAGIIQREPVEESSAKKVISIAQAPRGGAPVASISNVTRLYQQDAPPCPDCGAIMIRSGACYKCMNCGAVSGCS